MVRPCCLVGGLCVTAAACPQTVDVVDPDRAGSRQSIMQGDSAHCASQRATWCSTTMLRYRHACPSPGAGPEWRCLTWSPTMRWVDAVLLGSSRLPCMFACCSASASRVHRSQLCSHACLLTRPTWF